MAEHPNSAPQRQNEGVTTAIELPVRQAFDAP
jgi:hypothetical protein